jgi:hypothetical protein
LASLAKPAHNYCRAGQCFERSPLVLLATSRRSGGTTCELLDHATLNRSRGGMTHATHA